MNVPQTLAAGALMIGFAVSGFTQQVKPQKFETSVLQDVVFKDIDAKEAVRNLGRQLKLNVIFDESFRVQGKLDLELHGVTMESTLNILLIQTRMRASWIGDNTIIVYADNAQVRERLQEYPRWQPKAAVPQAKSPAKRTAK